ncbi:MAG: PaaI family thioesterase [Verrucomicrobiota bacterium]
MTTKPSTKENSQTSHSAPHLGLATPENWASRLARLRINLYPAYRRTSARAEYVAGDFRYIRIRLPFNRHTRNHNNSIYGGALYAAVDPIHCVMLLHALRTEDHIGWVRSATIRFRKPAREDLFGHFYLTEQALAEAKAELQARGRCNKLFPCTLVNAENKLHAQFEIEVHIRKRSPKDSPT